VIEVVGMGLEEIGSGLEKLKKGGIIGGLSFVVTL